MFETTSLIAAHDLRWVGNPPMILRDQYDPRQAWFSFIVGVVLLPVSKAALFTPTSEEPRGSAREAAAKFVRTEPRDRHMYHHRKGVHQLVLPFPEFQRITNSEFDRLTGACFPGWERMSEGDVALYGGDYRAKQELVRWCEQNCSGRFHVAASRVGFASLDDASLALLTFGQNLNSTT